MADGMNDDYRKAQIEFVSNNKGTTPRETVLLLLPCICGLFVVVTTLTLIGKYIGTKIRFVFEFTVVVLPSILCFTSKSNDKTIYCLILITISCINFILIVFLTDPSKIDKNYNRKIIKDKLCSPLTNFRSITSLLTAICILAVDFKIFPRRFSKTEVYGYSLMDTGVGFYILSNALVSREARAIDEDNSKYSGLTIVLKSALKNVLQSMRGSLALLILGLARYLSIELLNYQTHVTEYGVHWNFFITLATVRIFTSLANSFIKPRSSLILGIIILISYEYFLHATFFGNWVLNSGLTKRENFISSNREGISSTIGYTGLYFVGVALGRLIHGAYKREEISKGPKIVKLKYYRDQIFEFHYTPIMELCLKLSLITGQSWMVTRSIDHYFRVSRKLANAGYCAWMITISAALTTILILLDVMVDIIRQLRSADKNSNYQNISSTPEILKAINYNGLAFFLINNLLTGIINLLFKTIFIPDFQALIIITVYMIVGTGLFVTFYKYKIQLKL